VIDGKLNSLVPSIAAQVTAAQPPDWLATITTIAAAFGLNIAIPGGAMGIVAVKILGAWLRHRLAMRHAQRNAPGYTPAAEVGPVPFDRDPFDNGARGNVSAETKAATASRSTTIKFEPPSTEIETRTEIVNVPTVNMEAEALHEALVREARTFPSHAPIVKRVRSVAEQLLQGRRVTDSGRTSGNKEGSRVGWSDQG
jgi:hypothetical protein